MMELEERPAERGLSREEMESVVRRAVELYAGETDARERVSEAELLRIGQELGLPVRHVRQALYERLDAPTGDSWIEMLVGPARLPAFRVIPQPADPLLRRLETHLTTHEYLQCRRQQEHLVWLEPADDTISSIVRALRRPARRFHLARARRVLLAVRPLEDATSHVRIELDLGDRRSTAIWNALLLGGAVGLGLGTGGFFLAGAGAAGLGAGIWAPVAGAAAAAGGLGVGLMAGTAAVVARFRRRIKAAALELDGLLDRLERDEPLNPPHPPWRRALRHPAR